MNPSSSSTSAVLLRPARPTDRDALAALLRGLSLESAYRRFQTGLGPEPAPSVLDALLPDPCRGGAVVALVDHEVVGHGVWAFASAGAEIALVVADPHQGRGVGTALAEALMADLARRGVEHVEVFATATNGIVARMVARHAPDAQRERDGATVTYRFTAPVSALDVA